MQPPTSYPSVISAYAKSVKPTPSSELARNNAVLHVEAAKNRRKQPFLASSAHKAKKGNPLQILPPPIVDIVADRVDSVESVYKFLGAYIDRSSVLLYIGKDKFVVVDSSEVSYFLCGKLPLNAEYKCFEGSSKLICKKFLGVVDIPNGKLVVNGDVEYIQYLLDYMRRTFSLPGYESRNYKGMLRTLYSEFHMIPPQWVYGSYLVYCHSIASLQSVEPILDVTSALLVANRNLLSVKTQLLAEVPVAECELPCNWKFNCRWKIKNSRGFFMNYVGNSVSLYPTFTTSYSVGIKFMQISMCRLVGSKCFSYYDVNGGNATQALARYFKSRDSEDELFANQILLLTHARHYFDLNHFLSLGGASIESNQDAMDVVKFKPTIPLQVSAGRKSWEAVQVPLDNSDYRWDAFMRYLRDSSTPYRRDWSLNSMLKSFVRWGKQMVSSSVAAVKKFVFVQIPLYLALVVYDPLYRFYDRSDWLKQRVQLPHPSRLRYENYYSSDKSLEKILHNAGEWESKVKREAGKPGKVPRLYASIGELCLYEPNLPEISKAALHEFKVHEYLQNSFGLNFIILDCAAQSRKESDLLIHRINSLNNQTLLFVIFSDDGFLVYKDSFGHVAIYETDISSCDSSNGPGVFALAWYVLSRLGSVKTADALISQCARPTKLVNPSNSQEYVVIEPMFLFEYSGSVLTTFLNKLASFSIGFSLYLHILDNRDVDLSILIPAASRACGWVVTCDKRDTFNQVSFLKRSFSGLVSWKNYGCIFRSLGVFEGAALTALHFGLTNNEFRSKSMVELFELHLLQRLSAECNEPVSIVLNAWRERCGLSPLPIELPLSSLIERYGGSEFEWADFCSEIHRLQLGVILSHVVLTNIYRVDYSL